MGYFQGSQHFPWHFAIIHFIIYSSKVGSGHHYNIIEMANFVYMTVNAQPPEALGDPRAGFFMSRFIMGLWEDANFFL